MLSGTPVQPLWCCAALWSLCSMSRWLLHRTNSKIPPIEWEWKGAKTAGANGQTAHHRQSVKEMHRLIKYEEINRPCVEYKMRHGWLSTFPHWCAGTWYWKKDTLWPPRLCHHCSVTLSHHLLNTRDSDLHRPPQSHIPMQLCPIPYELDVYIFDVYYSLYFTS